MKPKNNRSFLLVKDKDPYHFYVRNEDSQRPEPVLFLDHEKAKITRSDYPYSVRAQIDLESLGIPPSKFLAFRDKVIKQFKTPDRLFGGSILLGFLMVLEFRSKKMVEEVIRVKTSLFASELVEFKSEYDPDWIGFHNLFTPERSDLFRARYCMLLKELQKREVLGQDRIVEFAYFVDDVRLRPVVVQRMAELGFNFISKDLDHICLVFNRVVHTSIDNLADWEAVCRNLASELGCVFDGIAVECGHPAAKLAS